MATATRDAEEDAVARRQGSSEYWEDLDYLRPHKPFAVRMVKALHAPIQALKRIVASTSATADKQQAIRKRQKLENLSQYLCHFCRLCTDTPNDFKRVPNPIMLLLVKQVLIAARELTDLRVVERRARQRPRQRNLKPGRVPHPTAPPPAIKHAAAAALPSNAKEPLSYDHKALQWNEAHTRNQEEVYCYCASNKQEPCLQCGLCKNWFHRSCINHEEPHTIPPEFMDWVVTYRFHCSHCDSHGASGRQLFQPKQSSTWLESVRSGCGHLVWTTQCDVFKVAEIADHLEEHWDAMVPGRARQMVPGHAGDKKSSWRKSLPTYVTNNKHIFAKAKEGDRPKKGYWSLSVTDDVTDGMGPALQPCRVLQGPPKKPRKPKPTAKEIQTALKQKAKEEAKKQKAYRSIFERCLKELKKKSRTRRKIPLPDAPPPEFETGVPIMLENLSFSAGTLCPEFSPSITEYSLRLTSGTKHVMARPWTTALVDGVPPTFTVQGVAVENGEESAPMAVALPAELMVACVVAGFASKTYTVTLTTSEGSNFYWGIDGEDFPFFEDTLSCTSYSDMGTVDCGADTDSMVCGVCKLSERQTGNKDRNACLCEVASCGKEIMDEYVWQCKHSIKGSIKYRFALCSACHSEAEELGHAVCMGDRVPVGAFKWEMKDETKEPMVNCRHCKKLFHSVCLCYDAIACGSDTLLCTACHELATARNLGEDRGHPSQYEARFLPETPLSKLLEGRLREGGLSPEQDPITVRVVSNVCKENTMGPAFKKLYGSHPGAATSFPGRQKMLFAFYKSGGHDVAFFSLIVKEYGTDCPKPNQNSCFISYLDSNMLYHCAACAVHHDTVGADSWSTTRVSWCTMPEECRKARRAIYNSLVLGYLDYARRRGLERCNIWVMPPESRHHDYVFYYRHDDMHIPTRAQLERWYMRMLVMGRNEGIISSIQDNTGKGKGERSVGFMFGGDDAACSPSLRNMAHYDNDQVLQRVVERVLEKEEKADQKKGARTTRTSTRTSTRPRLPKQRSQQRIKKVNDVMRAEGNGSYIVCHLNTDHGSEPLADDPIISIDAQQQNQHATLDSQAGLWRTCREFKYQFNTLRCGRHSTMMLLYYFSKGGRGRGGESGTGGPLRAVASQRPESHTQRQINLLVFKKRGEMGDDDLDFTPLDAAREGVKRGCDTVAASSEPVADGEGGSKRQRS